MSTPVGTVSLYGGSLPPDVDWVLVSGPNRVESVSACLHPELDALLPYVRPPWRRWWAEGPGRRRKFGGNKHRIGLPSFDEPHDVAFVPTVARYVMKVR